MKLNKKLKGEEIFKKDFFIPQVSIFFCSEMLLRKVLNAIIYLVPACLNITAFLTRESEDNLAWIKYWIVFSLLFALEILLELHKTFFPCFSYFKILLLCYCIASIEMNSGSETSILKSCQVSGAFFKIIHCSLNVLCRSILN